MLLCFYLQHQQGSCLIGEICKSVEHAFLLLLSFHCYFCCPYNKGLTGQMAGTLN